MEDAISRSCIKDGNIDGTARPNALPPPKAEGGLESKSGKYVRKKLNVIITNSPESPSNVLTPLSRLSSAQARKDLEGKRSRLLAEAEKLERNLDEEENEIKERQYIVHSRKYS